MLQIARRQVRNALSYCNADAFVPSQLWRCRFIVCARNAVHGQNINAIKVLLPRQRSAMGVLNKNYEIGGRGVSRVIINPVCWPLSRDA